MAVICPTITADNPHTFRTQLERIEPFAKRVQIDLADGLFTPSALVKPENIYWPKNIVVDLHLMYQRPSLVLDEVIKFRPQLIILHAEAKEELMPSFEKIKDVGIKIGLALLPETSIESVEETLSLVDHLLIFAGTLGSFGHHIDLSQLVKVKPAKKLNPNIEIGWDGGVNDTNVRTLIDGGVDVANVGGFIQRSESPQEAYAILESLI